jgi:hypothetical protein
VDPAFHAIAEHLVHSRLGLVVQIWVPKHDDIEGVQGRQDMRVVGIQ